MILFDRHIVLEIHYNTIRRPIDMTGSGDFRKLAVRIKEINFFCPLTGESLGYFDFRATSQAGWEAIYGLSLREQEGRWSDGPDTMLYFQLHKEPVAGLRIVITHDVIEASIEGTIRVNKGPAHPLTFQGGNVVARCEAATGDQQITHNVSGNLAAAVAASIIIVTHNHPWLTFACVLSVLASDTTHSYEIILVDNGSNADCCKSVSELGLPVRLLSLREPASFATANNIAAEHARGNVLLFLNNDAFVTADTVEQLLNAASDDSCGLAGPIFRHPDCSLQEIGRFISVDGTTTSQLSNGMNWESIFPHAADYVSAACVAVRRSVFQSVQGFDGRFQWAYFEDVDLCLKIRSMGKHIRIVPAAQVLHIQNATARKPDFDGLRAAAYAINLHIFRARWGNWLVSREFAGSRVFSLLDPEQTQRQIARFPQSTLNCVAYSEDIHSQQGGSVTALAAALSQLHPTALLHPRPQSVIEICTAASERGLDHIRMTACEPHDLMTRECDIAVVSSRIFPTTAPGYGNLRILHCPFPVNQASTQFDDAKRLLGALLNFDGVITDSDYSRRAMLEFITAIGGSGMKIQVIPPAIDLCPDTNHDVARDNIIVSEGPLSSEGSATEGHVAAIRAFMRLKTIKGFGDWRLVIVARTNSVLDFQFLDHLKKLTSRLDVDILAEPPRGTLLRLLSRAKVYLSLRGLGVGPAESPWRCAESISDVGRAISWGCVPVVFNKGADFDFVASGNLGFSFGDEASLLAALTDAAMTAGSSGLAPEKRASVAAYSKEACLSALSAYVAELRRAKGVCRKRSFRSSHGDEKLPALVVVGCHRSGTSAMARVLSMTGADLPMDLMRRQNDNPAGFWESTGIADFNDAVLGSYGTRWDDPFVYFSRPNRLEGISDTQKKEAISLLMSNFPGNRVIVLKDPRISVLIPLWDMALKDSGFDPHYVVMVREPREVAASLASRNGLPVSKGLLLWSSYLLAAERSTLGAKRAFVHYPDLLSKPELTVGRLQSQLGLGLEKIESASHDIRKFLRSDLHHQRISDPWSEPIAKPVHRFYKQLLGCCGEKAIVDREAETFESWLSDMNRFLSH